MNEGHIDNIIRLAAGYGKNVITAIKMATIQAAECFGLRYVGAVAPGYRADILVLNDLESVDVRDVYSRGEKVVCGGEMKDFSRPEIDADLLEKVSHSFHVKEFTEADFHIEPAGARCRVMEIIPGQLLTNEVICDIDFSHENGVDKKRDILKLAVAERHKNTGHVGLGFIKGIGIKNGAIASSVSHDSHNIIVIGSSESDMALAANRVRTHGGNAVVCDGKVVSEMALPIAGLMTDLGAEEIARANEQVREAVYSLGVPREIEPFMNMGFVSLPVIPSLKMTPGGLVDVNNQLRVSLFVD
jgi:adenine deaminase